MQSLCETCKDISCFDYEINTSKECLDYERMTNADRIRAMSDEELANFLFPLGSCPVVADGLPFNESAECSDDCEKCWLDWLKQEVDNEI